MKRACGILGSKLYLGVMFRTFLILANKDRHKHIHKI